VPYLGSTSQERDELMAEMRGCRDADIAIGDQGCKDDGSAVCWMCRRMLESVELGTY
jgi:hypothetical protein